MASPLAAMPPCWSCAARCDHALTWWCAGCDRWESCGDNCSSQATPIATTTRGHESTVLPAGQRPAHVRGHRHARQLAAPGHRRR
jgi:hypothetical protein